MLLQVISMRAAPMHVETSARDRLEAMVESHHAEVWRFIRHLGLSEPDVDEALQEVLLITAQKLDRIEPRSERAFLMGTAYRVSRRIRERYAKRRTEDAEVELIDLGPTPEAAAELAHTRELAEEMLRAMPLELTSVFVLFEVEELTTPEIAELLSIPQGTVASRLRRARKEFSARIARLEARVRFSEGKS